MTDDDEEDFSQPLIVNIYLIDINDNAPFLDMLHPVIWGENKPHGKITKLKARDYDSNENGPPFEFRIDNTADDEIRSKFEIRESNLYARVTFDRERRKSYDIPIAITDSGTPTMTGTSTLTVIIGDENDNPMREGSSSIFTIIREKFLTRKSDAFILTIRMIEICQINLSIGLLFMTVSILILVPV